MSTKPTDTKVLIIGAGLGGLTLAAICRRANIPYIVLERTEKLSPAGAGISLAPNALRVLDQLGVYSRVKENGQRLNTMLVHYEKDQWRSLDFTGLESKFGYPVYSIERHSFHEYLYDAAGGPENVRLGSKVVDVVDEYGSPSVVVKVADGATYTADVVVGADGIRSVTRRILAQNAGLKSINTIQFTGRVHMSGYTKPIPGLGKEHEGVGNWIFYDDAILTTWPCKDNRQWYIGVKRVPLGEKDPDRSVWEGTTKSMVNDVYGRKYHPFGGESKTCAEIIDNSERVIASNVFEEQDFPSMTSGRVALLGDAAHSMTSFFGQGACQAIEDATELGNALLAHYSSPTPSASTLSTAFAEYSEIRGKRGKDLFPDFKAPLVKITPTVTEEVKSTEDEPISDEETVVGEKNP
ncbi:putative 3-hydroxybenzoate 6-hydroxylase 1 [Glarea lozoyensis 74030]|uniref:Putative 3-hydroxybenzoate 6-hydroxylase 1 n=1 Tax=Glarea lozoyensis (strain ATCC 74030 / MF5533) TaxID=1104152 RepID=H0EL01_GLAL7|nr:putative 3-hydroxybenzoate 6-hydroxylase 1 [Glarea lozoyensis 74030]